MSVMASQSTHTSRPYRMLVIDLEPTPYKVDLWNTFSDAPEIELSVMYTERKNWSPDGGHNYQKWPEYRHKHVIFHGKGMLGTLRAAIAAASQIFRAKADLTIVAGYDRFVTMMSIVCVTLLRRSFVVHADEFNNQWPIGRAALLKLMLRQTLRKIVFVRGDAVLVCGRRGIESALKAGCPSEKVLDFPYVIDAERMKLDRPTEVPDACREDIDSGKLIVFFSGRMIPRKGLPTLLVAISKLKTIRQDWTLWIEGDGPELSRFEELARTLGVDGRCRFLGFCQFDVHSWLVRSSDIVVVPSMEDTWGIVVDEGIQLGKAVISSDATGSGYDRIEHGRNGYIFPAGNVDALTHWLALLIDDANSRVLLGSLAAADPKNLRPSDNLATLLKLKRRLS